MKVRPYRFALAIAACVAVSGATLPSRAGTELDCSASKDARISSMGDYNTALTSSLGLPAGRYALPEDAQSATFLVVMFHGHQNDSCSWRRHLYQATQHGAIAVAMDYSGTEQHADQVDYGWPVRSGAADSIAAAQRFLADYPNLRTVIAFGVSMGGNVSGYAVAAGAKRSDGVTPLFDYWIDVEGVNSILDEYVYVRALAPGVGDAAEAQEEIEKENGGPIEDDVDAYLEINNVTRAPDMDYLKGAVVVNGLDDSLVPTEQSPEMAAALHAAGVPTRELHVIGNGGAEAGSTYTGVFGGPLFGAAGLGTYNSPLAGHGWEGSDTQLVIKTGFDQLWALIAGGTITASHSAVVGGPSL